MAHVVFWELNHRKIVLDEKIYSKFKHAYDMAIIRHIKRKMAVEKVRDILEKARIPFILLKGSFLMNLYPEEWMRTSFDLDVLVQEDLLEKATIAFTEAGLTKKSETPHDISFFTQEQYHIELHHTLINDGRFPNTIELLKRVWQYTKSTGIKYEVTMNDEMFYFYHLAHMAKHFKNGGCGVRLFADLWLLNHKIEFDSTRRKELLTKSEICSFAQKSEELSELWFSNSNQTSGFPDFESYIIEGGIYGSLEHVVSIRKTEIDNGFCIILIGYFYHINICDMVIQY